MSEAPCSPGMAPPLYGGWLCLGCMSAGPCSPGMAPPLYVRGAFLTWNGTTPVWGWLCSDVCPWRFAHLEWHHPCMGVVMPGCMSVAPCSPGMAPPLYGDGYAWMYVRGTSLTCNGTSPVWGW